MFDRRRKFVIAASALVLTFVLALVGVVTGGNWVGAVGAIVGAYSTAEAFEGYANRRYVDYEEGDLS